LSVAPGHLWQLADRDHDSRPGEVAGENGGRQEPNDDSEACDEADQKEPCDEHCEERCELCVPRRIAVGKGRQLDGDDHRDGRLGPDGQVAARPQQRVRKHRDEPDVEAGHGGKSGQLSVSQTLRNEQRPERQAGKGVPTQPGTSVSGKSAN
jgi:hypothetical protein